MPRLLTLGAICTLAWSLTGCASTWDTVTSRKFRQKPSILFVSEDPMTVLRTSPEGDERAKAMRRLKEPAAAGRANEQEEAIDILTKAATSDPSPVVRVAAIDALSRFRDERALSVLTAAYHQAGGENGKGVKPVDDLTLAAGKIETKSILDRYNLSGPVGFAPDVAMVVRNRAMTALANSGRTEVVPLLTQVALGEGDVDRETRLAAVRGLSQFRMRESVTALTKVLAMEKGKDPALAGRAYAGLKELTGQNHPPEPETWEAVVRGGTYEIQPPPSGIQQAANWVLPGN